MSQPEELRGTLAPRVLPEVLRQVFLDSRSGVLQLACGADRCSLRFVGGLIEDCDTSIPGCHLGDVLVDVGFLGAGERDDCLEIAALSGQGLGETLFRHSLLDVERLTQGLSIQLREVLARALRWAEGGYTFVAAPPPVTSDTASFQGRIDPRSVLLDAIWTLTGDPILVELVGPVRQKIRGTTHDRLAGLDLKLNSTDAFLLSRVDGVATIEEILQVSPARPEETIVSLAGLISVGALEVDGVEAPRKATAEIHKSEMVRLAGRLHAADPHEVLGVKPGTRTEDIRASYAHLLKVCDPAAEGDAEMRPLLDRMTELLNDAYQKIQQLRMTTRVPLPEFTPAQALRNLPPPKAVLGPVQVSEGYRVDPERAVELADEAYEQGRVHEALALLHDAIPDLSGRARRVARVRLCRILLVAENGSKLALDELKVAIAEDPGNAEAHLLLGKVYREAGSSALATAALKKTLSLDPRNAAARAALRETESEKSTAPPQTKTGSLLNRLFRR